jgi:hypothetical protein
MPPGTEIGPFELWASSSSSFFGERLRTAIRGIDQESELFQIPMDDRGFRPRARYVTLRTYAADRPLRIDSMRVYGSKTATAQSGCTSREALTYPITYATCKALAVTQGVPLVDTWNPSAPETQANYPVVCSTTGAPGAPITITFPTFFTKLKDQAWLMCDAGHSNYASCFCDPLGFIGEPPPFVSGCTKAELEANNNARAFTPLECARIAIASGGFLEYFFGMESVFETARAMCAINVAGDAGYTHFHVTGRMPIANAFGSLGATACDPAEFDCYCKPPSPGRRVQDDEEQTNNATEQTEQTEQTNTTQPNNTTEQTDDDDVPYGDAGDYSTWTIRIANPGGVNYASWFYPRAALQSVVGGHTFENAYTALGSMGIAAAERLVRDRPQHDPLTHLRAIHSHLMTTTCTELGRGNYTRGCPFSKSSPSLPKASFSTTPSGSWRCSR